MAKIISPLDSRFDYIKSDNISGNMLDKFHDLFRNLSKEIDRSFLDTRERDFALARLEESWGWVARAIEFQQKLRESA